MSQTKQNPQVIIKQKQNTAPARLGDQLAQASAIFSSAQKKLTPQARQRESS